MEGLKPYYVLGLDIGSNSVGWAAIETTEGVPVRILGTGVRVFPEGVKEGIDRGREESRAVDRRLARQRRRLLDRRKRRLIRLANDLQAKGFLPKADLKNASIRGKYFEELDKELFHSTSLDSNPQVKYYRLRARALDEKLFPHEFGRALYHLAHRRGFNSGLKGATKSKEKETDFKTEISGLALKIQQSGARTIGEYFSRLHPLEERIRKRHTSRPMFLDEFEKIWDKQAEFHSALAEPTFRKQIKKGIFFQRPLKSSSKLIGFCELEPGLRRCPISHLKFQRFRLLQKVNDLKIISKNSGEIRDLNSEERKRLIQQLEEQGDLTFAKIRKSLGLEKTATFNFQLEEDGHRGLIGNRTAARFRGVLGSKWDEMAESEKNLLVDEARLIQKDRVMVHRGQTRWGLSEEKAVELWETAQELEDGYASLSLAAIQKLLPHMESGTPFAKAKKSVYGDVRPPQQVDQLPPLTSSPLPEIRNPAVSRALTETRKVVNSVLRTHGKPEVIRIELARDLKKSRTERKEIFNSQDKNRKKREAAEKVLKETGIPNPQRSQVEKWLLAEECGWICPYSGKEFNPVALFGNNVQVDVEHIVPWARSLDDSFSNKTLCFADENRNRKGNRTPFEAYSGDTERWNEILARVSRFKGDYAEIKLRRFQLKDLLEFEEFSSRQLNDTRYASLSAVQYLGLLYGSGTNGVDVSGTRRLQAGRGQITKYIRDEMGLNKILNDGGEKTRDDHRHHAVDALAIALTSPKIIKDLSDAAGRAQAERRHRFGSMNLPWDQFSEDARKTIESIVVSHKSQRKVDGAFHAETFFGKPYTNDQGKSVAHIRKTLDSMGPADVENIVDPTIRKIVQDRLQEIGKSPKEAFTDPNNHPHLTTKDGREIPIHAVRVRKNITLLAIGRGAGSRFAEVDENHHVEIFEEKGRNGQTRWGGVIVNRLEARQRLQRKEPVVNRNHGPGKRFLFSLSGGDIFQLENEPGQRHLYTVRSLSRLRQGAKEYINISYVKITDARKKKEIIESKEWFTALLEPLRKLNCKKVTISPLGEIRWAND